MADLPRWIDDARVDSAAMLAAFEGYLAQYPESMAQFQSLFVITHCCPDNMSPAWTLPTREMHGKRMSTVSDTPRRLSVSVVGIGHGKPTMRGYAVQELGRELTSTDNSMS